MPEYDLWAEKICHIYKARPTICRGDPIEADHTAIWMEPNLAIKMITNIGDRMFLEKALR